MKKYLLVLLAFALFGCSYQLERDCKIVSSAQFMQLRACMEYQANRSIDTNKAFINGAYKTSEVIASYCQKELKIDDKNKDFLISQAYYILDPKIKEYLDENRRPL